MKAVAYRQSLPIDQADALEDVTLADPKPGERDLRVRVHAISVNPVDTKVRKRAAPPAGEHKVLGWDVAGVVESVGAKVSLFKPGDRVWYAGDITRPGANSELHCVDERIVGAMPKSLSFAQAAALPLTAITAWEMLFDRLGITEQTEGALLIVGAAGGVGSVMTQLARQLTKLTVIGTASRPETHAWVRELGAHHVIDHAQPLSDELQRVGVPAVTHVASLTQTDKHYTEIVKALAPQGHLCLIDDPATPPDVMLLKQKSIALHWEFMFTRSMFKTADMQAQHDLLTRMSQLVDEGRIRTTLAETFGPINAANLKKAHAFIESGTARGKVVLEGF